MLLDLIVCLFGLHAFSWDMVFLRRGGHPLLLAIHSTLVVFPF